MNELEELRRLWQTANHSTHPTLAKEQLMALVEARVSDVRRSARRRLQCEASIYLVLAALPLTHVFAEGFDADSIAGLALMMAVGALGVTLEVQARRLRSVELSHSLREALTATLERLERAGRLYFAVYMAVVLSFLALLVAVVGWRSSDRPWLLPVTVLGAVGFALWSYRSGQAYVARMLGKYRGPLEVSLRELDADEG